jgi:hypothetical protein
VVSGADVIEHGTSRTGRWLKERRLRIVLWTVVLEGIVVALSPEVSRLTIVIVALLAGALYFAAGRRTSWDAGHEVSWILAMSQSLAVVFVILAHFIFWLALLAAAGFAVVALVILWADR